MRVFVTLKKFISSQVVLPWRIAMAEGWRIWRIVVEEGCLINKRKHIQPQKNTVLGGALLSRHAPLLEGWKQEVLVCGVNP